MDPTDTLFLAGRILLGGYFLVAGISHFRGARMMAGYTASKNVPAPMAAVLATGVLLALGGLSIITGVYPYVGLALIAVFLVGVTPTMHDFWTVKDPMQRMGERVNFQKNMALLGAIAALSVVGRPWPVSL